MAEKGASEKSLPHIQSPSTEKIRMLSHQFGFDLKDEDISMYQANSKENFVGTKRVHSADSSGCSLVIKKSKHGSGDKIEPPDVKEPATDSKSKEPPDDINPLLDTLVYHHFYDTDALAGELEDPGSEFCLAGKIACVPRPTSIQYRFDLLMALQV